MHRSLRHYWRMNLAVIASVAVTTAVMTGALLVGDSLRGSLQDLTLERLGRIDHALINNRFFPETLADRLAEQSTSLSARLETAPVLLLKGSAVQPDSDRRASAVQVIGIEPRFGSLFPESTARESLDLTPREGQIFPSVVVNEPLLAELGAKVGDDVLLSFGRPGTVPSASLLGRREQDDLLSSLRLTVTDVVPATGPGRFSIELGQNRPFNAFVELEILQKRLDRPGEVNLLLLASSTGNRDDQIAAATLHEALQSSLQMSDLGLQLRRGSGWVAVESAELVLRPGIASAVMEEARRAGVTAWPYLTYLANGMEVHDRSLPYSTVAALQLPLPEGVGNFTAVQGIAIDDLQPQQIALNSWAATRLQAEIGDPLNMTFFLVGADDELIEDHQQFEVAAVVDMTSLGADPTLTPEVPGISDAGDIAGWDPPFPVDLDVVGPDDEAYWDAHRGAPKAFLTLARGQELWRSRYGALTSIRLVPGAEHTLDGLKEDLEARLLDALSPELVGFDWLPVLAQGLQGASGTTDFASLFLGFSLFLITSAALLVGLLFALLVEQRSREVGLLLATGFTVKTVRRRFLGEGLILAVIGVLVGTTLAALYTWMVLRGLANWWAPVLDSPVLRVHIRPQSLLLGGLVTLLLVILVIAWTVRRVSQMPIPLLLAGKIGRSSSIQRGNRAGIVTAAALAVALLLLGIAWFVGIESAPGLFFGVGAALVLAGIAAFAAWSHSTRHGSELSSSFVVPRLAARNCSRNLGRSLLSVTLVACATFVLVSVSASRKTHGHDPASLETGTGGFTLVAEVEVPLPERLDQTSLADTAGGEIYSLRLLPGDDASCLNLYQPEKPRVLGVPEAFIRRGGFSFRDVISPTEEPWTLLDHTFEDEAIPTIGDYNSVRWILHSGLGNDLVMQTDAGEPIRLRIVGLLDTSIFQSELLISETQFLRHFPDHAGFSYFLGSPPIAQLDGAVQALESSLPEHGLDAESAVLRLENYQAVENMYLTTFEVLGGLGILLGTVGLGVVLLRNTLERRGELATLRAFGYRRSTLAWIVVAENAWLLVVGLTIGTLAGLIAVAPHLITGGIQVPWGSLARILGAILAIGLLSSLAAVIGSLRVPLLPALKAD